MKKLKIVVFIDAGNLWPVYKSIQKVLDFSKFKPYFENNFNGEIFKIFYYVAYPADGTRDQKSIEKFHKYLVFLKKGLNFEVVKKQLKTINLRNLKGNLIYDRKTGKPQTKEKGNFDVEITIDALRYSSAYNIAVFFSGDSDFLPLISYLRNLGNKKIVYVFSCKNCVSTELRTGADGYYDIAFIDQLHGNSLESKK